MVDQRVQFSSVIEFSLFISEVASDRTAASKASANRLIQRFLNISLHLLIESLSRDLSTLLSFCKKREVSSGLLLFLLSPRISFTIDLMSPIFPLDLEEPG